MLLLSVIAVLALTACNKKTEAPDVVVDKFLTALTQGNYAETAKYTEVPVFDNTNEKQKEFDDLLFARMSYTPPVIVSQDDVYAVVSTELTGLDVDEIAYNLFLELNEMVAENPDAYATDEQRAGLEPLMSAKLTDALKSPDAPIKTLTVQFNLVLLDVDKKKSWTITPDDAIEYGIYLTEPMEDYSDYDYGQQPQVQLLDTVTTKATYMGGDEVAEMCSFSVDGVLIHMFCDPSYLQTLEADYLNKEVEIMYGILGIPELEALGDDSFRMYVLAEIH